MRRPALLLLAALLAGAAPPEPPGYRLDDYRAPVPETLQGATVLHLADVQALVERRSAVLIDVLPAPRKPDAMRPGMPWLPPPHNSLPGALWWPDVGRGTLPPELEASFHRRLEAAAGPERRKLVFFCLSQCWMSWNAAKRAASWGYDVAWFPDGVDTWQAAHLPTETIDPTPD